jgi:asparagine synthase (glutamine-hydrolysing)
MRWHGFTRQEIEALCGESVSFEHTKFLQTFSKFSRAAHFDRYSALEDTMPNDRVHQAARMTNLRVRFPYYATRVDAYMRVLPVEYRYQPGVPKRILRELLARHVPRSIWEAPKHGFDFPLLEFLQGNDYALSRVYLDEAVWNRWQVLDPTRVADYGKRFIAGEHQLMFRVWALVVLAAWLEGHSAEEWCD